MPKEKMSNEKTSNKIGRKTNVEQKDVERKKSTKKKPRSCNMSKIQRCYYSGDFGIYLFLEDLLNVSRF
jgi:hypothetical protein